MYKIGNCIFAKDFEPLIISNIDLKNGNIFAIPFDFERLNKSIKTEIEQSHEVKIFNNISQKGIKVNKSEVYIPEIDLTFYLMQLIRYVIKKILGEPLPYYKLFILQEFAYSSKKQYISKQKSKKLFNDNAYLKDKKDLIKFWQRVIKSKNDISAIKPYSFFNQIKFEFGDKYKESQIITTFNKIIEYKLFNKTKIR